jgi:hypothetical protein
MTDLTNHYFFGSCLCGAIKYKVHLPVKPEDPTQLAKKATKCNCTICQKPGFTNIGLSSPSALTDGTFVLISPSSPEACGVYRSARMKAVYDKLGDEADLPRKYFCKDCGVQVWHSGQYKIPAEGSPTGKELTTRYFCLNLNTLDQDEKTETGKANRESGLELSEWKPVYIDGLPNNQMAGTQDVPFAGGVV